LNSLNFIKKYISQTLPWSFAVPKHTLYANNALLPQNSQVMCAAHYPQYVSKLPRYQTRICRFNGCYPFGGLERGFFTIGVFRPLCQFPASAVSRIRTPVSRIPSMRREYHDETFFAGCPLGRSGLDPGACAGGLPHTHG
jgi:hypothetical protein